MTKKKSGVFYTVLICLGLIALILLTYLQVVFGNNNKQSQKEISVIVYSAGSDGWESFEQGIKQAENDFFVNINYVVLRAEADATEQFAIIEREITGGAEGVVVAVSDYTELYNLWLGKAFDVPIVTVESGFDEITIPLISADNYEMGKRLGEEILKDFKGKEDLVVAIDTTLVKRDSVREREQGLREALEGKADVITLRAAASGKGADVAVALDKEALLELSERTDSALTNTKNYGIGNTASIVAALDQDKIEKIVFQNEFNMGYLAVETLLEEIDGINSKDEEKIEFYCVGDEELYDTPYEHLLFPIVE